jgi:hypothetical protein
MITEYYQSRRHFAFWIVAALFAYAALAPSSACTKWGGAATAMRASILVTQAASMADRIIGEHIEAEHARCRALHAPKTAPFDDCARPALSLHKRWKLARTSVTALNLLVQGALTEYYLHLKGRPGGQKMDPIKVAARSVCALAKALRALRPALPALAKASAVLAMAEGVSCALGGMR